MCGNTGSLDQAFDVTQHVAPLPLAGTSGSLADETLVGLLLIGPGLTLLKRLWEIWASPTSILGAADHMVASRQSNASERRAEDPKKRDLVLVL